jgi:hypothetical protein
MSRRQKITFKAGTKLATYIMNPLIYSTSIFRIKHHRYYPYVGIIFKFKLKHHGLLKLSWTYKSKLLKQER